MDWRIIKGVHHINILVKDGTPIFTKENDYISTLESWNLDEIATTFMDYSSNEMAHYEHSNHDYNHSETQSTSAKKYPLLTQFVMPTDLSSPTNRYTIRSILRDIEKLNSDHDLIFMCMKSTTAKPFLFQISFSLRKHIINGRVKV